MNSPKQQATKTQSIWNKQGSTITIKEIEFIIKSFQWRNHHPDGFAKILPNIKKIINASFHHLFQKTEEKETLFNSFNEASITLTKTSHRTKKLQTHNCHELMYKIFNKTLEICPTM